LQGCKTAGVDDLLMDGSPSDSSEQLGGSFQATPSHTVTSKPVDPHSIEEAENLLESYFMQVPLPKQFLLLYHLFLAPSSRGASHA
jgi:hypothetical protein